MNKRFNAQQGFSLIELAIVIIISGILFAAAVSAYKNYFETSRVQRTQAKFDTITRAMDRFFATYGRYPCPARLDLGPNDAGFGVETRCDLAPPANGISVAVGNVRLDRVSPPVNRDIRIGAIPFVTLKIGSTVPTDYPAINDGDPFSDEEPYRAIFNISSEDTIDLYNNKLTYALTEDQGTPSYVPYLGAVIVKDEHDENLSENGQKNHADYVVVSHGENAGGAWTYHGEQFAGGCAAALPDNQEENCNGDDTYIASLNYDTGDDEYDDVVLFRNWVNYFLWDLENEDEQNIYNLNSGNVGVGIQQPVEKLHILAGNAVTDEVAATDASVQADEYCGATTGSGPDEDCFTPDTIAGDQTTCDILNTTGDAGNLGVKAIQNNTISCEKIYTDPQSDDCGTDKFIKGFSYDSATQTLTADCEPL